ncbi:MAG: transposase, partial [Gammaproteobacteria bacterium]
YREQAVKLVTEEKLTIPAAARRLSMSQKTLANWVHKARQGQFAEVGDARKPVTALDAEVSRLKRNWPKLGWSVTS